MSERKGMILNRSFAFAVDVVNTYKYLTNEKKEFVLSKQFLRNGTAVGALSREAQNAESKADFIHKFSIAQKECDETIYWLELLFTTEYMSKTDFERLSNEAKSLLKMIRSTIMTTNKISKTR
jgi:four helix bundle protein